MQSKAKPATKEERSRMRRVNEIGCIVCLKKGIKSGPAENHHLLDGGRRRGHRFTIGLCGYHHAGRFPEGVDRKEYRHRMGPALTDGTKLFRMMFGTDDELLKLQDDLIEYHGPTQSTR